MASITKRKYSSIEQKLISNIAFPEDVINECWIWVGKKQKTGHGKFYWNGHYTSSYRAFYKVFINDNIDGLDIDHLCKNPPCMNLLHLEPVTSRINTLRGSSPPAINAAKTHCKNGHAFNAENTAYYAGGKRRCRECSRIKWRAYYYQRMGTETTGKWMLKNPR